MTEVAVTLTDYALALESAIFAVLLQRRRRGRLGWWLSLFFASVSAGAACGGTVHGFFLDQGNRGSAILWPATLLALGLASVCLWAMGAEILLSRRVARWTIIMALAELAVY